MDIAVLGGFSYHGGVLGLGRYDVEKASRAQIICCLDFAIKDEHDVNIRQQGNTVRQRWTFPSTPAEVYKRSTSLG